MAEGGFVGGSSAASASPGAGVTYYGNYGNSAIATVTANTTEANSSLVYRGPGATLKNLRVVVSTNSRGAASTWTTLKNGTGTSQSVSLAATGTYSDLTNNVSLSAGDTFGYSLAFGGSSGALFIGGMSINMESSGQAATMWSAPGSVSTTTASVTRYYSPTGNLATAQGVEAAGQVIAPTAGVISNLRVVATASRATATTVRTRINGANGNQSVSVTAAGTYEDVTNSDTVVAGSLVTIASVTSTGSDTLTLVNLSLLFTPSTARVSALMAAPASSAGFLTGVTRYSVPSGFLAFSGAEAGSQIPASGAGTASYLCCTVSANGSTTDVTLVLRVAGVDTAVTLVIPAGATGSFADSTHSVAIAAGALVSVKFTGATTGGVTVRSLGLAYLSDAAPVTSVGTVTLDASPAALGASSPAVALGADVLGRTETAGAIVLDSIFAPSGDVTSTGTIALAATISGNAATAATITLGAVVTAATGSPRRFVALL